MNEKAWWHKISPHMSTGERVALAWLAVLVAVSGIWTIIGYVNRNTTLVPQTGGIYHEAAVGQPRHINPILAGANDLDVDLSSLIYSPLFKLDAALNVVNDLATGYELSADQTEYLVHLRSDVTWHDGQPFNADDVVFTIRSIQTPDYGSPLQSAFQDVIIEKVDDASVKFKLKKPYAPFIISLTAGIVPEHVWAEIAPQNATLAEQMLKPVGTGPYKFEEFKTRRKTGEITEFSLARNDAFYGSRPLIDKIIFNFFASHDEAVDALAANQVEGIGFLPLQLREQVVKTASINIQRLNLPQYFGLFFNQTKNELLADAGIRNALALAIDRDAIIAAALFGEGEAVHLPIPPGIFGYNEALNPPGFNPEAAKQNLTEAGWRDEDQDGVRTKNDKKLQVKITTTDWPEYARTAEVVRQQWQAIGVEVEVENLGAGTIQQTVIGPRNYEVLLFGEILSAIPDPYPFWHSTQVKSPGLNFSLLANEEVDKLLEEARKTTDEQERRGHFEAFQGKILDLNPAIILYRPLYLFAAHRTVRGINPQLAAVPAGRFNNIAEWHVKVKRVWQ